MSNEPETITDPIEQFIARWEKAEAAERANYQMFLTELCDLLEPPHPDPAGAKNEFNQYVFDRAITRSKPDGSQTTVRADLIAGGRSKDADTHEKRRQVAGHRIRCIDFSLVQVDTHLASGSRMG